MSLVGNDTESDTESGGQKMFRHSGWKGRTGSMNKRGRKFLSVSLAAMMTLNMLPVGTIYAEETVTEASSESKETQAGGDCIDRGCDTAGDAKGRGDENT